MHNKINDYIDKVINEAVPKKKIWLPKLEMYFCPLPFKLEGLRNTYHALYGQYREPRIYDEIGDLVSWLTITYHNEK